MFFLSTLLGETVRGKCLQFTDTRNNIDLPPRNQVNDKKKPFVTRQVVKDTTSSNDKVEKQSQKGM